MSKWPGAYPWHNSHHDHHFRGGVAGGVLIDASRVRKAEVQAPHPHMDTPPKPVNDQAAGVGVSTYGKFAAPYGTVDKTQPSNLLHYPLHGTGQRVDKLVADHGYKPYYAGGNYGRPNLAERNYTTGHLMVYDPQPESGASFNDREYTDAWRKSHELAHALTYPELNRIYGEGRRIGSMGKHRTLREAQRAVHWEWLAGHKQRELLHSIGVHVPDEAFNKEMNTVMHDAVHRAVTGKFTEPSGEGFRPHPHKVPLENALQMVRDEAARMGLRGDHDLLTKSEHNLPPQGATVADEQKLTLPQALERLTKGLKSEIQKASDKFLELRKRELKKSEFGVCLLCGEIDHPDHCNCLKKTDSTFGSGSAAGDTGKGLGTGSASMAMSECGESNPGHKWMKCSLMKGHDGDCSHDMKKNALAGYGPAPAGAPPTPQAMTGASMARSELAKVTPPGREDQVKELKGKVNNPWAVAWASYNKGHKKSEQTSIKKTDFDYKNDTESCPHCILDEIQSKDPGRHYDFQDIEDPGGDYDKWEAAHESHHRTKKTELADQGKMAAHPEDKARSASHPTPKGGAGGAVSAEKSEDYINLKEPNDPETRIQNQGDGSGGKVEETFGKDRDPQGLESEAKAAPFHIPAGSSPIIIVIQKSEKYKKAQDKKKVPDNDAGTTASVLEGRDADDSVLPLDKDPKVQSPQTQEGGNDIDKIKKDQLPMQKKPATPPGAKVPLPGLTEPRETARSLVHGLVRDAGKRKKTLSISGSQPSEAAGLVSGLTSAALGKAGMPMAAPKPPGGGGAMATKPPGGATPKAPAIAGMKSAVGGMKSAVAGMKPPKMPGMGKKELAKAAVPTGILPNASSVRGAMPQAPKKRTVFTSQHLAQAKAKLGMPGQAMSNARMGGAPAEKPLAGSTIDLKSIAGPPMGAGSKTMSGTPLNLQPIPKEAWESPGPSAQAPAPRTPGKLGQGKKRG